MVNVVAAVIGTVAAPPERVECEKLPSGDVSVQFVTPCVFQNIDAREPSGTLAGTAQISAFGGTFDDVEVAAGRVVVARGGLVFCGGSGVTWTGVGVVCAGCADGAACAGAGVPTWYPREVQRLSKNEGGTTNAIKFAVHGRAVHRRATRPCDPAAELGLYEPMNPATVERLFGSRCAAKIVAPVSKSLMSPVAS